MSPAMATLPVIVRVNATSAEDLWGDMARDSSSLFQSTHNIHHVDITKILNHGSGNRNAPFLCLFVYHPVLESAEDAENSTVQ